MAFQQQPIALLSVYDKAGLLPLAHGLADLGVRLLGSGGTAKAIRNAGLNIESVPSPLYRNSASVMTSCRSTLARLKSAVGATDPPRDRRSRLGCVRQVG